MLIFINGSINSGKTTISKLLAKELGNTAHIEVDALREFVDFLPLDERLIVINLTNAALVARTFIEEGLDVIISYPLSAENYALLLSKLGSIQVNILAFTLSPRLEVALRDRGGRKLDDWERERIKHHYQIGINRPTFDTIVIDNSDQTPAETVAEIVGHIQASKSLK